ncbi:RNA 3'-terminal phosphate cyclase-like protein isoform X2 [Myotis lucifugus]|uniref:RNA 3'-terminal phosphate cyclase-like protein isoform X2 n=1 Tax=Myotis lucifugus TaxID=59463 RepID=UPI000CCC177A|nr:RNA 3'-terminal phosphate cyclase-like protein isoform X2 [Myotis lucifugus]
MATQAHSLSYAGCNFLRQRLVLSTLSGRPVKIRKIRARDDNPGLRDFEASFIRLLDKITNGSRIEINQTGTTLYYQPGLLYGGSVEHDCSVLRGIGYYLESLLCLAPFMKHPLRIVLRGVTNDQVDPSVDVLKATALPILKQFGIDGESLELKIVRRGMPPGGGGEVIFSCPIRKVLKPIQLTDPGKIKRIRGMAYSVRVSPQMANRIVDSARSILNKFIPDIYIYTDHMKGVNSGNLSCRGQCPLPAPGQATQRQLEIVLKCPMTMDGQHRVRWLSITECPRAFDYVGSSLHPFPWQVLLTLDCIDHRCKNKEIDN